MTVRDIGAVQAKQITQHDKELQQIRQQLIRFTNLINGLTKENRHLKSKVNQLTHDIASLQRKV